MDRLYKTCQVVYPFVSFWSPRTLPREGIFTVRVFLLLIMCIGLSNILSSKEAKQMADVCEDKNHYLFLYPLYILSKNQAVLTRKTNIFQEKHPIENDFFSKPSCLLCTPVCP